jgi:hypothetical protein
MRTQQSVTKAANGTEELYQVGKKWKHQPTLELIFSRPVTGTLP